MLMYIRFEFEERAHFIFRTSKGSMNVCMEHRDRNIKQISCVDQKLSTLQEMMDSL